MTVQGTDEWLAERCGKVTASRISDLMATVKSGGYGASRANYMAELVAERLSGTPSDHFTNDAMRWGTEREPEARAVYEFMTNVSVETCGFIHHPTIPDTGASPDGLVGDHGLVEIKAPNTATHIDTLLSERVPDKYVKQMQWQMVCAQRGWCDFVSFDPRLPGPMQLFVKRVSRDNDLVEKMEAEVRKFLCELDQTVKHLRTRYEIAA